MSVGNIFAPKPGRFGIQVATITTRPVFGTLAAGTVAHMIGGYTKPAVITSVSIAATTFPTAATSVVATLQKKPSGTAVALTSGLDINTKTAQTAVTGTVLGTVSDADKTLQPGETLLLSVVTTGAVSVQPVDVVVTVELLVQE
jgi:hypothetical protein